MSPLVTMIILGYLLLIALCMMVWSAVSLRGPRKDTEARGTERSRGSAGNGSATRTSTTRTGARTTTTTGRRSEVREARESRSSAQQAHGASRGKVSQEDRLRVPEAAARDRRTEPNASNDVATEPRKEREGKGSKEDPFERFLRANDDY